MQTTLRATSVAIGHIYALHAGNAAKKTTVQFIFYKMQILTYR